MRYGSSWLVLSAEKIVARIASPCMQVYSPSSLSEDSTRAPEVGKGREMLAVCVGGALFPSFSRCFIRVRRVRGSVAQA